MNKSSGNIKNSSWNLANILLYPIAFLALTPFFINKLGEDDFGIWMLLNSYVYIAVHIVSFGLGNSITAHVAEALGKNSSIKLFGYLNVSTKLIINISIITILVSIFGYLSFKFGFAAFGKDIDNILVVATILISIKFWELLFQSILKGFERYDLASFYNILSKLSVLAAQVLIVVYGRGLLEIFISNVVINVLMAISMAIVTYIRIPDYKFSFHTSKGDRTELFHFGFWTWLQTIISVLAYQIDRFVIAIFLGPAITGYYILASTIINHMHMAFGAVVSWLLPKISRKKELDTNITGYFTSLRSFSIGFGLLAILVTYLVYEPIFILWLGPDKFSKMGEYFRLFLIFETFLVMTIVPLFYLNGIKMLKFITSLELMYKTGVIIGLFVAFAIVPTAESIIIGQIIALIILIPVEYFLINNKILFSAWYKESLVAFIPSMLLSLVIITTNWYIITALIIAAIIAFKSYYLSSSRFSLKLLLE